MLPFAGIPTFIRSPHFEVNTSWHADVGVLGVPFDIALGFRPGARFAPRAIREASLRYTLPSEGFYDLRSSQMRLAGLRVVDAGDVDLPSLEPELARERITEAARHLRSKVQFPLFLGGDHSISYPLLKAFDNVDDLHVVQLDAHLDFTDVRNNTQYSNSSPFRRACEDLSNLKHITTIGLRGLRFDQEAVEAARARGHTLIPSWEIDSTILKKLPQGKRVYLSFDVDVFDPTVFPATSSPEVSGLSYAAAVHIINEVVRRNQIVGFDLVEMTPHLDPSGNSALLAARLLVETLMAVFA
jgi:agmatinase